MPLAGLTLPRIRIHQVDYNLMMSGGENGSQESGSTGPSVHEGIQG